MERYQPQDGGRVEHNKHEDDTKDREAEVSSSSGNSGTVVALGVAQGITAV